MFKYVRKYNLHSTTKIMVGYASLVVLAGTVIAVISANHSPTSALKLATSHTVESFTELYFNNPGKLPAYAAPGKRQTASFHIENDSPKQQSYSYVIDTSVAGRNSIITGVKIVQAGSGVDVPFGFTIPKSSEQAIITINLIGTNEQLTLRSHS